LNHFTGFNAHSLGKIRQHYRIINFYSSFNGFGCCNLRFKAGNRFRLGSSPAFSHAGTISAVKIFSLNHLFFSKGNFLFWKLFVRSLCFYFLPFFTFFLFRFLFIFRQRSRLFFYFIRREFLFLKLCLVHSGKLNNLCNRGLFLFFNYFFNRFLFGWYFIFFRLGSLFLFYDLRFSCHSFINRSIISLGFFLRLFFRCLFRYSVGVFFYNLFRSGIRRFFFRGLIFFCNSSFFNFRFGNFFFQNSFSLCFSHLFFRRNNFFSSSDNRGFNTFFLNFIYIFLAKEIFFNDRHGFIIQGTHMTFNLNIHILDFFKEYFIGHV